MAKRKAPEITFQEHIAAYLTRMHGYCVLDQAEITKQAGEILGMQLLDHIIFNRSDYFSFLEAGQL